MPTKKSIDDADQIILEGVRTHNLKNISLAIPKNKITTITGVSGSGKSSLAFDTIYKEGQFRYIESLSSYLRQFFNLGTRPDLDYSSGLSPAIAIEQNKRVGNARSTVGTLTEIDDYLRLLLSKLGEVYCYGCGTPLRPKNTEQIVSDIKAKFMDEKVYLLQEIGIFEDASKLNKFIRRNRKQVDQGEGMTRLLVALEYDQTTDSHGDLVEYFYLEDPNIPDEMLPVKVYGIFDRVTINQSTINRLKDDIIKMLARADKFGVKLLDGGLPTDKKKKTKDKQSAEQVIIMHGSNTDPDKRRYSSIQSSLQAMSVSCSVPKLPTANKPKIVSWKNKLAGLKPNQDTILVGHDAGGVAILRWLEDADASIKIKKIILISTSMEDTGVGDFYTGSFDYKKIKKHCNEFVVFHALDDHIVPVKDGHKLATSLGATSRFPEDRGHFDEDALPELLDEIIRSLTRSGYSGSTDKHGVIRYTDKYYCATDNISYPELTPQHFSANRQEGACQRCHGLGEVLQVDFEKVLDPQSPYLNAVLPWRDSKLGQALLKKLAYKYQIEPTDIWKDLPEWFREVVVQGDKELLRVNIGGGKYVSLYYNGIEDVLTSQYQKGVLTVDFQAMLDLRCCPHCKGAKLRPESLHVFLIPGKNQVDELLHMHDLQEKYNIYDLQSMSISELNKVMTHFKNNNHGPRELIDRILHPLLDRAGTIEKLGLGYITTSRQIDSLSGGEIQRLRLAKQLGNKLTGVIYVLDEPTIGLDHAEILKVVSAIEQLKEIGNTIVVVEHNETFIKASDWIVEVGPGAGDFGGEIIFNGPYTDFIKSNTLTADYITGKRKVTASFDHTPTTHTIEIKKASKFNLQNIDVSIRLGSFTIITGPSGAGKTTLMYHTLFKFLNEKQQFIQSYIRLQLLKEGLSRQEIIQASVMKRERYEHLEQLAIQEFYAYIGVDTILGYEEIENVLYVDQTSIGKTPRSCPATFVGVFDDIRKLYAGVTESKMLAFNAGHFSFNSSKGACPECNGYGHKKVELQFLPDTYVPCTLCKGSRYKPEILDIKRHGVTISEILDMYVMDALTLFEDLEFIYDKLLLMKEIGLGYLKMGQPAHTLSGGESQRLKLVKHLLKQYRGHTVYFLDEPTVGLHPNDIERLLGVLRKFLDKGDTVLMIEHERNLLQFADDVIRLEQGQLRKQK